jgi:ketosteroid isomerase-like protein
MLEELDPEVEWHSALSILLSGKATVYRGHDGVREWFRELDDALDEIHVEYTDIRDLGDRVVAIGHIRTRGRESGVVTESPLAMVSDTRNGKSVRVRTYLEPAEALQAAGLSE